MRKTAIATLVLGFMCSAASAQMTPPTGDTKPSGQETSRAECQANFKRADADGNGTISVSEAENAKSILPTQLALSGPISESEFMTACEARLPKGG